MKAQISYKGYELIEEGHRIEHKKKFPDPIGSTNHPQKSYER